MAAKGYLSHDTTAAKGYLAQHNVHTPRWQKVTLLSTTFIYYGREKVTYHMTQRRQKVTYHMTVDFGFRKTGKLTGYPNTVSHTDDENRL